MGERDMGDLIEEQRMHDVAGAKRDSLVEKKEEKQQGFPVASALNLPKVSAEQLIPGVSHKFIKGKRGPSYRKK